MNKAIVSFWKISNSLKNVIWGSKERREMGAQKIFEKIISVFFSEFDENVNTVSRKTMSPKPEVHKETTVST